MKSKKYIYKRHTTDFKISNVFLNYLKSNEIFTRRYFYPSLSKSLPYLPVKNLEVTDDIAKRVLCLPLYYDLTSEEVDLICRLLLRVQNN